MQARSAPRPEVSIIIPARDEAEALPDLLLEIAAHGIPWPHEVVVVDDGSSDGTGDAVRALELPFVRLLRHETSGGKSRAIRSGALAARGALVVTMDGDGQNDPRFLPDLLAPLRRDPTLGLVAGQRTRRHDGWAKKGVSRLANRMRRALLYDDTHDTACGLKAMRRDAYLLLPFFDNNHRFLPALFLREGWKITHVSVEDRPRTAGRSKYGIFDRALVGLPDLLGVWWLRKRAASQPAAVEILPEIVDD